jgi:hypothetical protein
MAKADLRKKQWDLLFRVVEHAGFAPLTEVVRQDVSGDLLGYDGNSIPALVHKPTKFYFAIAELPPQRNPYSGGNGPFGVAYQPGEQTPTDAEQYLSWDEVVRACMSWLSRVREDSGPDLWELAAQERTLLAPVGGAGLENTPFTSAERSRIEETLDTVLKEVKKTQELSREQTQLLTAMIADVKESANRFSRKDWMLLLYGSIINVVTQAAFAPDQTRNLLRMIGQGLAWVFHTPPMLP